MGKSKANNLPMVLLYMLILAIVAGCAPAFFRTNPQLQEKVPSIKTVAIMPPGVKVYQLTVGGGTQLMDEETVAVTQMVAAAIEKELGRHAGVVFKPFPSPSAILDTNSDPAQGEIRAELEDTQALFEAVSASVLLHTYSRSTWIRKYDSDQTFPEKLKNFDYSLGPEVQRLAKLANADALLFTSGVDHISTGGRKALMTVTTVISTAAFLFGGSQFGGSPFVWPEPGKTVLSVALVDPMTGALLWYNVGLGASLTYPEYAADLAEQVFNDFPLGERPTRVVPQDSKWRW
ncbi:MAG TPA: hypothetical protein VJK02_06790 [Anaerolineales bacterium]|nr:hypothetical protein [Anaerolineales bacterium]